MAEDWQSCNFRQSMVAKINEMLQKTGQDTCKNAFFLENQIFHKSRTKDEYLELVAKVYIDSITLEQPPQQDQTPSYADLALRNLVSQGNAKFQTMHLGLSSGRRTRRSRWDSGSSRPRGIALSSDALTLPRFSLKDVRNANRLVTRLAMFAESQLTDQQKNARAWALGVIAEHKARPDAHKDSEDTRQSSEDDSSSSSRRSSTGSNMDNCSAAKESTVLAVIDRSVKDCAISAHNWAKVEAKLALIFVQVMAENPGPPPNCNGVGWQRGVKLVECCDKRSVTLYKMAIAKLGEVWPGARLEAIDKHEVPRHKACFWLPIEPADAEEIIHIFKMSNPNLPVESWKIVKLEEPIYGCRPVEIVLSESSLPSLIECKGLVRFGFTKVRFRIYKENEDEKPGVCADDPGFASTSVKETVVSTTRDTESKPEEQKQVDPKTLEDIRIKTKETLLPESDLNHADIVVKSEVIWSDDADTSI